MNLTCGRNPWKRASIEDNTFRAYLNDPDFLRTILPISAELNAILKRIFEYDPAKRITIPELRRLILECPRFTTSAAKKPEQLAPYVYCRYPPVPPADLANAQYSDSAVSDTSLTDGETNSTVSSVSERIGDSDDGLVFEPQVTSMALDPAYNLWTPVQMTGLAEKPHAPSQPVMDPFVAVY